MQTSDLNVNNTESDHATAIFRQFQDAIFSREHTSVKTLMKIIFDLLHWQEITTLSQPKKAVIASFISMTFRGYFCLRANDIARSRSRVIFSRACADIFGRWRVTSRLNWLIPPDASSLRKHGGKLREGVSSCKSKNISHFKLYVSISCMACWLIEGGKKRSNKPHNRKLNWNTQKFLSLTGVINILSVSYSTNCRFLINKN